MLSGNGYDHIPIDDAFYTLIRGLCNKHTELIGCDCRCQTVHIHNAGLIFDNHTLYINMVNNCHKLYKLTHNDDKRYRLLVNPHENAINSKYWRSYRFQRNSITVTVSLIRTLCGFDGGANRLFFFWFLVRISQLWL